MAKQIGLLTFTGKLGNVIGYRRNGNYFMRTMPETVHQTMATRQAARNFGIASSKGKLIRRGVTPHLNIKDSSLVNRLNKALVHTGSNCLQGLKGFRFNRHAATEQFFCEQPFVSSKGSLIIPAQLLPATGTATHLEIKFISARINIKEQRIVRSTSATIIIDLSRPFNGATLEAAVPGNGTLILVLQIRTFNGQEATGNRRFMAADIIGIMPSRPLKKKTNSIPSFHKLPYNTPHTCLSLRSMDREIRAAFASSHHRQLE
ncbi:hypothetical protein [Chitinophaga polysaccharea]|uniref:hypothetical protein n=1 Tax=Chitinophaga polysaccharea TaxID=1293035 RepID=UPI00115C052A|nr:hypothetical protein [Chitinophaga polysaccharea]